jgi:hypothetical protein
LVGRRGARRAPPRPLGGDTEQVAILTTQLANDTSGVSVEATPAARADVLAGFPLALRWWLLLCAAGAASLIGARALHYLDLPLPDAVDRVLDRLMQAGLYSSIMWLGLFQPNQFGGIPVLLALLALCVRPRWFVRRQEEGRLATMPWLYALMFGGLALGHIGLDMNPWVALGCAGSAALALAQRRLYSRSVAAALVAAFLAGWVALSPTSADAVAVVAWGGILALLALLRTRWLTARDVFWLGAFLSVITQIVASAIPNFWPRHGGTLLGQGMAYGFCEQGSRGRLYAAVPGFAHKQFRDGHIVEYDLARLTKLRDLSFFDQEFHGRFMQLLCLPDRIQAAMAQTWLAGKDQRENVMEFRIDDPRDVKRSLWGPVMGQQLLWDKKRDAVFYSSEWSNRIFRLDRRTGEVNRNVNAGLIPDRPTWLFHLGTIAGSLPMAPTPHRARDSFFVGHWLTGSTVYEIDLGRLALRRRFEPRNGCIAELAVDEEYDRLFATSLWGVDVIDLRTGRVVRRIRTGTGARTPAIDRQNGLVYVSTTLEGKLRAFDRATLEPAGALPIGWGTRRALVSAATGRLFATNEVAYYWWNAAALAARLRGH